MRKTLLVFFLLSISGIFIQKAMAQINLDETIASEYMRQGAFDKAGIVYKRLFDNNPGSQFFYQSYLTCLVNTKQYEVAKEELKKLVKKNRDNYTYAVDLGYVYKTSGDDKNAKAAFEGIIKSLPTDPERIRDAAVALVGRDEDEYAILAFLQGRKLVKVPFAFADDLGQLYNKTGKYQEMIDEYLAIIDRDPFSYEDVKDKLQDAVVKDDAYELLKKALLKRIQSQPGQIAYSDLLSWLFIQKKDFAAAFVQIKALDKHYKEGGKRMVELANVVANYAQYDFAETILQSVLDMGESAYYYIPAQKGMLDIQYYKVTRSAHYTQEDLTKIETSYLAFINKYGTGRHEAGDVVLRLAEVYAEYDNKVDKALTLLKTYEQESTSDNFQLARAKLALGDYSLLTGDVWESTLYYSQVEKLFRDNPLGHEAKFRNDKLAFYRGDFEWANAQLDVLKGSTSELIANDALQLSLLIQDNLGLDSSEKPLYLFAEADFFIFTHHYDSAEFRFDSIRIQFPNHALADDILMKEAEIAIKKQDYTLAVQKLESVYTNFATDILADDALYKAAQIEEFNLSNKEKALQLYEKLLLDYKGSVYGVDAREHFRVLRGDKI